MGRVTWMRFPVFVSLLIFISVTEFPEIVTKGFRKVVHKDIGKGIIYSVSLILQSPFKILKSELLLLFSTKCLSKM
jgi:hypothetical protein